MKDISLEKMNDMCKNTLMEHLSIAFTAVNENYLLAEMPVDKRTHQPMGLLHGGASAAMIESIGSMGSALLVDLSKASPVGIEINANHVRGISSGIIEAKATILHKGGKIHVWNVEIREKSTQKLLCTGRLTNMIVPNKK